jgi:hypothetical protein
MVMIEQEQTQSNDFIFMALFSAWTAVVPGNEFDGSIVATARSARSSGAGHIPRPNEPNRECIAPKT